MQISGYMLPNKNFVYKGFKGYYKSVYIMGRAAGLTRDALLNIL